MSQHRDTAYPGPFGTDRDAPGRFVLRGIIAGTPIISFQATPRTLAQVLTTLLLHGWVAVGDDDLGPGEVQAYRVRDDEGGYGRLALVDPDDPHASGVLGVIR